MALNESKAEAHGYLIAVEVLPGTDPASITRLLAEALAREVTVMEYDVDHMGQIELVDEVLDVGGTQLEFKFDEDQKES